MICSSCYQPCDLANVVSWQRIGARVVTWVQCFGCYEAEEKRVERERNEKPAAMPRSRRK